MTAELIDATSTRFSLRREHERRKCVEDRPEFADGLVATAVQFPERTNRNRLVEGVGRSELCEHGVEVSIRARGSHDAFEGFVRERRRVRIDLSSTDVSNSQKVSVPGLSS